MSVGFKLCSLKIKYGGKNFGCGPVGRVTLELKQFNLGIKMKNSTIIKFYGEL